MRTSPVRGQNGDLSRLERTRLGWVGRHLAGHPPTSLAVAVLVAVAIAVRLPGLTSRGLWRDDAWTALTSRVGPSTAVRMSTTTPGFTLLARTWMGLHQGSSLWAQVLPLSFGVGGVVAIYALARYYGLSRWIGLLAALVVATSPVAAQYSTHVKQYSADFLLACLLLWVGERARRSGSRRDLIFAAALSAAASLISASVLPVVGGVWVALVIDAVRHRERRRPLAQVMAPLVGFFLGLYFLVLRDLPPVLHRYWLLSGSFLDRSSLTHLVHSTSFAFSMLTAGLFAPAGRLSTLGYLSWSGGKVFVPACLLVLLLLAGVTAGWRAATSALTLGVALLASLAGRVPLGTGRTDEVIYPAVLLLAGVGIQRTVDLAGTRLASASPRRRIAQVGLAGLVVAFAVVTVTSRQVLHPPRYPEIDVRALAAQLASQELPGDRVLVDPYTRYPWALYEARHVHVSFGGGWGAGFTVVSDRPDVFISPSETWERDYAPDPWASQVADAGRLWYLGTTFLSRASDPVYQALVSQGWQPQQEFDATGGFLVLMTGGGTAANRLLTQGLAEQTSGNLQGAFDTYHAAIDKDPTDVYAYYDLGLVDSAEGHMPAALQDYRTAIFFAPTYTPAMFNLAALVRQQQPDEAIALYRQILTVKPGDPKTELNLGLLLIRTGHLDEGRADIRRAVKSDPSLGVDVPSGVLGRPPPA